MVNMYVGNDQATEVFDRKVDLKRLARFAALEQAAIDEQSVTVGESQLMAGTGDTVARTVMNQQVIRMDHRLGSQKRSNKVERDSLTCD